MGSLQLLLVFLATFLLFVCATLHYSRKSAIPFVTWILLGGTVFGIGERSGKLPFASIDIHAEVVFFVLLPLLIFASAKNIKLKRLEAVGSEVGFFATVGTVVVAVLIAMPMTWFFQLPFWDAFLFGAILSATDPVAILSIFARFQMPEKLKIIVEGESLLNDGTAIILFALIYERVWGDSPFVWGEGVLQILWAFGGAILLGLMTGYLAAKILHFWHENKDDFIEPTITVLTALLTFLVAEHFLHTSGVIAVMFCAMTFANSNYTLEKLRIFERKAHFFDHFWNFVAALANSILFFLLGIAIALHSYAFGWVAIPVIIVLLVLARSIVVYGGSTILGLFGRELPFSWQHVLNIGGLKGALSIALLLLLPANYPYRPLFLCLAFVLILFTLLVNTLVMEELLKKLKL